MDILIVDDSRADRELLRRAFNRVDATINLHVCKSGQDALDFLFKRGRHLLTPAADTCLLDLKMPGLSGIDVLSEAKSHKETNAIPMYIFSSSDDEKDVRESYENQASGYIQKPRCSDELEEIVRTLSDLWKNVVKFPPARNA